MDLSFLPPHRRDHLMKSFADAAQYDTPPPALGYSDFIGLYQARDILFFRDAGTSVVGNIDLLLLYRDGERIRASGMKQEWLLGNADYLYYYLAGNKDRTVQLRGDNNGEGYFVSMEWNHFHPVWKNAFTQLETYQNCLGQTP